jgi:hypothetical protein
VSLSFDGSNNDAEINSSVSKNDNSTDEYTTGNAGSGLALNNTISTDVEDSSFSSSFMSSF